MGLEATIALVNNNPRIIFSNPDKLNELLREYGQLMGWGREQVLLWLQRPCSSQLPDCKPGQIINTARDYAAHAGLSEQEMLQLLETCPGAFISCIVTLKAGWKPQATHPSWALQWGGYDHSTSGDGKAVPPRAALPGIHWAAG